MTTLSQTTLTAPRAATLDECLTLWGYEDDFAVLRLFGDLSLELAEKLYHAPLRADGLMEVDCTPDDAVILLEEAKNFNLGVRGEVEA